MLWSRGRIIDVKCLSQRHNDTSPSSETKQTADTLAIANLRSFPLSYIAASRDENVKCFSQAYNYDMPAHGGG